MKILFTSDVSLFNPASGAELVLNQQATGLIQKKCEIYAITRRNSKADFVEFRNVGGIKEACYAACPEYFFCFLLSLAKYPSRLYDQVQNKIPFSSVVCHQPFTCFSLLAGNRLNRIPLLYVFHSPNHEEYLLSLKNQIIKKYFSQAQMRKMIERFCLKRSKKIMVLSRYMKQRIVDIHRIPNNRIVVNPGGVDLDRFVAPKNRRLLKNELHLPVGAINLFTVRNLEPRMGLDNLLKAIALLKEKTCNVHLVMGGEGPERNNLENLIRNYGLKDDVSMTGFIPADQLPKYYGAADFFVLPTRELEGFGLVTPESMACGTPVLGTPVGGTEEILSGFDSQFLFKDTTPEAMAKGIAWAIDHWFNDKERYASLRGRCREYVEKNYSWQRHVDQLKSIIDEIVAVEGKLN
jgi:glycosyltransferase involved in cell wall biosynthesis